MSFKDLASKEALLKTAGGDKKDSPVSAPPGKPADGGSSDAKKSGS